MSRWRALFLLSLAELLGMSLWFSASSVAPALRAEWGLAESATGWLTLAVQMGFVVGTLLSAILNLPDVLRAHRLVAAAALLAACANAAIALFAKGATLTILLRFATGLCLAGVYPPGMKIIASWFRRGRGLALGALIGALTLGKASPYLLNVFGGEAWRGKLLFVSLLAAIGGLIVLFVGEGPFAAPTAPFDARQAARVFRERGVRLANLGYFGHMWELYAMWTWTPVMIRASLDRAGASPALAEIAAFLVIGSGAIGCVAAGFLADRAGRTLVASAAMVVSGACCLTVGFLFGGSPSLLLFLAVVWGMTVVADSAQFSACVTELADPRYLGTALTMQTCVGFLLTTASIELVSFLAGVVGWRYAFLALAPGPFLGAAAMLRLRALPEAARLADGRR